MKYFFLTKISSKLPDLIHETRFPIPGLITILWLKFQALAGTKGRCSTILKCTVEVGVILEPHKYYLRQRKRKD